MGFAQRGHPDRWAEPTLRVTCQHLIANRLLRFHLVAASRYQCAAATRRQGGSGQGIVCPQPRLVRHRAARRVNAGNGESLPSLPRAWKGAPARASHVPAPGLESVVMTRRNSRLTPWAIYIAPLASQTRGGGDGFEQQPSDDWSAPARSLHCLCYVPSFLVPLDRVPFSQAASRASGQFGRRGFAARVASIARTGVAGK